MRTDLDISNSAAGMHAHTNLFGTVPQRQEWNPLLISLLILLKTKSSFKLGSEPLTIRKQENQKRCDHLEAQENRLSKHCRPAVKCVPSRLSHCSLSGSHDHLMAKRLP